MNLLTISLLERIGLLLIAAFIVTRAPSFRHLLDRNINWKSSISYSILFGLFGIAGIMAGTTIRDGVLIRSEWYPVILPDDILAHSGLVGIVVAGLLGGPVVGLGAGMITGAFHLAVGEINAVAYAVSAPFIGIFAGLSARFFSKERIISPSKSFFIGMFATILTMCFILILTKPADQASRIVNDVGIPMVISNSMAIAIFTIMIRIVLNEKEHAQASETKRALTLADKVLPYLKQGLTYETARTTAQIIMDELETVAVALTDQKQLFAHVGLGEDHHLHGHPLPYSHLNDTFSDGKVQVIREKRQLHCSNVACQLGAAVLVPFTNTKHVAGLIILYYRRSQQIRMVDIALAEGLGKLISNQLIQADAERISSLMRETELRTLQAQINPHFLFNTLNSIISLIRLNPATARKITLQLAQLMRSNLSLLSTPLVPLHQELEYLRNYIGLMKVRFEDRIEIVLLCDHDLEEVPIPPLTLQPIVENSIQHGLKNAASNGLIQIFIQKRINGAFISIRDNGSGVNSNLLRNLGATPLNWTKGNGVGLYNVNQRLTSLLGKEAGLQVQSPLEGGCLVQFTIPFASPQKNYGEQNK